ncbi:MAG: L-lactate permease [Burkholderiales bacterium]|nr:L-lactate permease [Burkholderiales bacterium]
MPLLSVVVGFITGSTVSANALLMQVQKQIGENVGDGLLFSAMQSSASGHAAMFSLSIMIMITMIAKDYAKHPRNYESLLLSFNIKCLLALYLLLVINLLIRIFIA